MNSRMNIRDIFCKGTIVMLLIVLQASESNVAQEVRTQATGGTPGIDAATIERLTGVKGKFNEKEGVFKVSVPRTDLQVTVANMRNDTTARAHLLGGIYQYRRPCHGHG